MAQNRNNTPAAAPAAKDEQSYQYLYRLIPAHVKEDLKTMQGAERDRRTTDLENACELRRAELLHECKAAQTALRAKPGDDHFAATREVLPKALYNAECVAYLRMTEGRKPDLNHYLECLQPIADTVKSLGGSAREHLLSREFRTFLDNGKKYREIQGASLLKLLLTPLLIIAMWYGLIQLFSAPFMAGVLAHQIWEYLSYVIMLIICLGVIAFGIATLGLIWGFVVGIFGTALVGWLGMMLFEAVIKLTPAVAANFEAGNEWSPLFFFMLWLVLAGFSLLVLADALLVHTAAIGKAGRLAKKRAQLRSALPNVQKERFTLGELTEMADYCEAAIRWEKGHKQELQHLSADEATALTDGLRQWLQPICQKYDEVAQIVMNG